MIEEGIWQGSELGSWEERCFTGIKMCGSLVFSVRTTVFSVRIHASLYPVYTPSVSALW